MIIIDKKIKAFEVVKNEAPQEVKPTIEQMHEKLARPEALHGATYKIKPPHATDALYITINDMVLNADTEHEERRPFEIFLNSKNAEHTQWMSALTRVISAVFRKGGDVGFLADELKAINDPQGGYWRGERFIPSLVADIGYTIEKHIKSDVKPVAVNTDAVESDAGEYPANATLCGQCSTKAVVMMDGCATCLSCGFSKCG